MSDDDVGAEFSGPCDHSKRWIERKHDPGHFSAGITRKQTAAVPALGPFMRIAVRNGPIDVSDGGSAHKTSSFHWPDPSGSETVW